MALKLKDGHTYVTRSGVKRKVRLIKEAYVYGFTFECAPLAQDGIREIYQSNGKYLACTTKHPWDFVKEFKSAR